MSMVSRASGFLVGAVTALSVMSSAALADEIQATEVSPTQFKTVSVSKCGPPQMSTPGIECQGFAGREILKDTTISVVGFENTNVVNEKHIYQAAVTFDLSGIPTGPDLELTRASLNYAEASTTRRSAAGDSEYGILPSCNTKLGVGAWDGSADKLVMTTPAKIAGATPATTGDAGSWDVTPQLKEWMTAGTKSGTFVMSGEDESLDIREQAMCLSYVINLGLSVEQTLKTQP